LAEVRRHPGQLGRGVAVAVEARPGVDAVLDAFGADVHAHLCNTARQELAAFQRVVTDWERRRNFDQW
ncbi:MAG: glutamine synthetase, partial [Actinomycetota bacterium]